MGGGARSRLQGALEAKDGGLRSTSQAAGLRATGRHPPVQAVNEVTHVVGQDDAVLAHVAVVAQHAHGHVGRHLRELPQDVAEGPWGAMEGEPHLSSGAETPAAWRAALAAPSASRASTPQNRRGVARSPLLTNPLPV